MSTRLNPNHSEYRRAIHESPRAVFWLRLAGLAIIAFLAIVFSPYASAAKNCSWDDPGKHVFMGDVVKAVDRYTDIPDTQRAEIQGLMRQRAYTDIAVIRRDTMRSDSAVYDNLRQMHFGQGQVCETISRDRWPSEHEERALIYCVQGWCVAVPTVCRNVSRIDLVRLLPPRQAQLIPVDSESLESAGGLAMVPPVELLIQEPDADLPSVLRPLRTLYVPPGGDEAQGQEDNPWIKNSWPITWSFSSTALPPWPLLQARPPELPVSLPEFAPLQPIPEPSTLALLMLGFLVVLFLVRRR